MVKVSSVLRRPCATECCRWKNCGERYWGGLAVGGRRGHETSSDRVSGLVDALSLYLQWDGDEAAPCTFAGPNRSSTQTFSPVTRHHCTKIAGPVDPIHSQDQN